MQHEQKNLKLILRGTGLTYRDIGNVVGESAAVVNQRFNGHLKLTDEKKKQYLKAIEDLTRGK